MAQRDFEKFKQEIKSWMEAHPDKYDAFVEEVNDKSFEGIQRVYTLAMRLAPQACPNNLPNSVSITIIFLFINNEKSYFRKRRE